MCPYSLMRQGGLFPLATRKSPAREDGKSVPLVGFSALFDGGNMRLQAQITTIDRNPEMIELGQG